MKNVFTHSRSGYNDLALLMARVAIALLMLTHGIPKLQMLLSGEAIQFPSVFGMGAGLSLGLAVFAEVFCSILLLVGFATRLVTIPLIITMLVAVFSIHAADVFAKKELAVFYLVGYLVLLVAGSGRYSLDHLLQAKPLVRNPSKRKDQDPALSIYQ